jgi:predicted homoserine dehydrogenase-like protein
MAVSQLRRLEGLHVVGVADPEPARARAALLGADWPEDQLAAAALSEACARGTTCLTDDAEALIDAPGLDVLVEATGAPGAAARHALRAFEHGVHVVNVTVEADALLGSLLGARAKRAGVVHSYAFGDQPALICDLVDWARTSGFPVVSAGKGTKYLPSYHASTPESVWEHYGLDSEHAARQGLNPRMFNSFLDGTKSAIEMAAVANATGLVPQVGGLRFPPSAADRLARVCVPETMGGSLTHSGTVEVVSSLDRSGAEISSDLRWGVYVVFEAPSDYVAQRFAEYGVQTDPSGRCAALWRPFHFIGLEIATSVLRAGIDGQPTGSPSCFVADVVSVAKRDLTPGERLDGEGGYCVWGRLEPFGRARAADALPLGLAEGATVLTAIAEGEVIARPQVEIADTELGRLRAEAERLATTAMP